MTQSPDRSMPRQISAKKTCSLFTKNNAHQRSGIFVLPGAPLKNASRHLRYDVDIPKNIRFFQIHTMFWNVPPILSPQILPKFLPPTQFFPDFFCFFLLHLILSPWTPCFFKGFPPRPHPISPASPGSTLRFWSNVVEALQVPGVRNHQDLSSCQWCHLCTSVEKQEK